MSSFVHRQIVACLFHWVVVLMFLFLWLHWLNWFTGLAPWERDSSSNTQKGSYCPGVEFWSSGSEEKGSNILFLVLKVVFSWHWCCSSLVWNIYIDCFPLLCVGSSSQSMPFRMRVNWKQAFCNLTVGVLLIIWCTLCSTLSNDLVDFGYLAFLTSPLENVWW